VARFFNEAKALSRLEHPSIVQVSDFGSAADGTAYLVMEYLHGQSLGRRLRDLGARRERLPIVTALQVGFQVADVLTVAHAEGIVHRDIKPDNLMLIADTVAPGGERVKLLDFGIAKLTHSGDRGGIKTATQAVMGTPSYMSPEQCAGAGGVDEKTDVYALGCVIFEMLTGRTPFVAEGPGQLIGMHLFQPPPAVQSLAPKVPEPVAELVHRMLIKDKKQRLTMNEAADAIGKLLQKSPGGGTVLRSRPIGNIDPHAGQATVIPTPITTLGRSIGEQTSRAPRRSVVFGSVIIVMLGGGLLIGFRGKTAPGTTTPAGLSPPVAATPPALPQPVVSTLASSTPAVEPVAKAEPRTITWSIVSEPAGSSVFDAKGMKLGTTPFVKTQKAEPGTAVLRIRQEGYNDEKITLSREQDESQQVTLKQVPPRRPSRSSVPKAPSEPPPSPPKEPPAKPSIGYVPI